MRVFLIVCLFFVFPLFSKDEMSESYQMKAENFIKMLKKQEYKKLDLNNDGDIDAFDFNDDSMADSFDVNNIDLPGNFDINGNYVFEAFDTNGDGLPDSFDSDENGEIDLVSSNKSNALIKVTKKRVESVDSLVYFSTVIDQDKSIRTTSVYDKFGRILSSTECEFLPSGENTGTCKIACYFYPDPKQPEIKEEPKRISVRTTSHERKK